jgi:LmbE family N-acetylglucosaminyl deacetylase
MERILVLSPHPDDAPLSLGGWIHQRTQSGDQVTILTAMSADPALPLPSSPIIAELHARWAAGQQPSEARRAEDSAAARVVGAEIAFLSITDCIYRTESHGNALYQSEASLFSVPHPDDPALPVPATLRDLVSAADVLIAPLTVGGHVDHRIVQAWALELWHSGVVKDLRFFTDYPYAENVEALNSALERIALPLQPDVIALTEFDVRAKINAIACYHSQISTFWSSVNAMETTICSYLTGGGQHDPSETLWHPMRSTA